MAHENEPQQGQPTRAGSRPRARRIARMAGLAAGVALLGGAAIPAAATATTAPPAPQVSGHQVASAGQASAAAQQTIAYWTRARMLSARNADTITFASRPRMPAPPAHPSGPAGQVAGAAPVQPLAGPARAQAGPARPAPARAAVAPRSGSTGSGWTGSFYLPPATTTGKVFFTTTGNGQTENWVCSASTVNSNGKDAVLTAGHCVYGSLGGEVPGEGWHSNWMFVPDYYYGYAPYGVWTARQLWTLSSYYNNQDEGDDIGAAVMNTNSSGQHIVNVVGGQGLAWNWAENQYVYDFGYPAAPPFNGMSLQYCNGGEFNWPYVSSTMGLACNFTGGSSGGPWLRSFGGEFGYINGVNDFGYSSLPGEIFSAYFGNNADSLYNSVANL
jgi:V8-like Glu-specific endopeptidase